MTRVNFTNDCFFCTRIVYCCKISTQYYCIYDGTNNTQRVYCIYCVTAVYTIIHTIQCIFIYCITVTSSSNWYIEWHWQRSGLTIALVPKFSVSHWKRAISVTGKPMVVYITRTVYGTTNYMRKWRKRLFNPGWCKTFVVNCTNCIYNSKGPVHESSHWISCSETEVFVSTVRVRQ